MTTSSATPPSFPPLKVLVNASQSIYKRDLQALYEHASDRFGDVKWGELIRSGIEGEDEEADFEEYVRENHRDKDEEIWAHKAIIYARASKSFKSRFFPSSNSSSSQPSMPLIPSATSSATFLSPHPVAHQPPPRYIRSASALSHRPKDSYGVTVLSHMGMAEILRAGLEGMYDADLLAPSAAGGMRTGKDGEEEGGMEWLLLQEEGRRNRVDSKKFDVGLGLNLNAGTDQLSSESTAMEAVRKEDIKSMMREKQAQDLTYMWRSKLYADVIIQVPNPSPSPRSNGDNLKTNRPPPSSFRQTPIIRRATSFSSAKEAQNNNNRAASSLGFNLELDKDLGFEVDEETGAITFSAHRFMLCSRSPYFAQVLLNAGEFQPHTASVSFSQRMNSSNSASMSTTSLNNMSKNHANIPVISLHSPPFTPQAVHFILGYIYSGSLSSFSNKQLDLTTAFLVRKGATYLEMDALEKEVDGRLVWEFGHGVAWDNRVDSADGKAYKVRECRCRKCVKRVPKLLRFALYPDVNAEDLAALCKEYVVRGWGECLSKDIALLDEEVLDQLVDEIVTRAGVQTVVPYTKALVNSRRRIQSEGKPGDEWVETMEDVLDEIAERIVQVTLQGISDVLGSEQLLALLEVSSTDFDVLEGLMNLLVEGLQRIEYCKYAPQVYQVIVDRLLNRRDETTEELVLVHGSRSRRCIESAKSEVLNVIRVRWLQIRQEDGFTGLKHSILDDISQSIAVAVDDLLPSPTPKRKMAVSLHSSGIKAPIKATTDAQTRNRVSSLSTRLSTRAPPVLGPPVNLSRPDTRVTQTTPDDSGTRLAAHVSQQSIPGTPSRSSIAVSTQTPPSPATSRNLRNGSTTMRTSSRLSTVAASGSTSRLTSGLARQPTASSSTQKLGTPSGPPLVRKRAVSTPTTPGAKKASLTLAEDRPPVPRLANKLLGETPPLATDMGKGKSSTVRQLTDRRDSSPTSLGQSKSTSSMISKSNSKPELNARTTRVVSGSSLKPSGSKPTLTGLTPGSGRQTPAGTHTRTISSASVRSTASTVGQRAPLASREKVPTSTSVKQTASSLAKVSSTATRSPRRLDDARKLPFQSDKIVVAKTLRTTPAIPGALIRPSDTTSSTKPTSLINTISQRNRMNSGPDTRAEVSVARASLRKVGTAGGGTVTLSKNGPVEVRKEPSDGISEGDVVTPIDENVPTSIPIVVSSDHRNEGLSTGFQEDTAINSPSAINRSNADPLSTLPRSFGDQLNTRDKVILGLPVIDNPSRPALVNMRTPSASSVTSIDPGRYHPASAFDPPSRTTNNPAPALILSPAEDDGVPDVSPAYGSSLTVGIPCIVALMIGKVCKFKAMTRYIGKLESDGKDGEWVGVEVEAKTLEKNGVQATKERLIGDGVIDGKRYFRIEAHKTPARRSSHSNFGSITSGRGRSRGGSLAPNEVLGRLGGRSASASPVPWAEPRDQDAAPGKTVALFVRPQEVVFVLGASE